MTSTPEFTLWKEQCKERNPTAYFQTNGEAGWKQLEIVDGIPRFVKVDGPTWTDAVQLGQNKRLLLATFDHNKNQGVFFK